MFVCGRLSFGKSVKQAVKINVIFGIYGFKLCGVSNICRNRHSFFKLIIAVIPTDKFIRFYAVALSERFFGRGSNFILINKQIGDSISVRNKFHRVISAKQLSIPAFGVGSFLAEFIRYTVYHIIAGCEHGIHLGIIHTVFRFHPLIVAICNPYAVGVRRLAHARINPFVFTRLMEIAVSKTAVFIEVNKIICHIRNCRRFYEHYTRCYIAHFIGIGSFVACKEIIYRSVYLPPALRHYTVFVISCSALSPACIAACNHAVFKNKCKQVAILAFYRHFAFSGITIFIEIIFIFAYVHPAVENSVSRNKHNVSAVCGCNKTGKRNFFRRNCVVAVRAHEHTAFRIVNILVVIGIARISNCAGIKYFKSAIFGKVINGYVHFRIASRYREIQGIEIAASLNEMEIGIICYRVLSASFRRTHYKIYGAVLFINFTARHRFGTGVRMVMT